MNKDESNVKFSEVSQIPKVKDESKVILETPYYWSWYRFIFSTDDALKDD